MKVLILCAVLTLVFAEPPVDNRYLPPQQGFGNGGRHSTPSQTYGPPGGNQGFGAQRQTDAVFGSRRPSSNYGAPSAQPSNQYIPPQRSQAPSSQYGAPLGSPSNQYGPPQSQPSRQYGAPSQSPSRQYGPPSFGSNSQPSFGQSSPSQEYGTPSNQYEAPSFGQSSGNGFGRRPSNEYSAPSQQYGAPSQQYGAPSNDFGANQYSQNGNTGQSRQYLPPGGGRGNGGYGGYDGNGEPANYNFEYTVKDDASGNDFGHRESRQGDRAEGLYYVVLPDGRKQTVMYEADQNGYRPSITYEDVGFTGGYNRNSQGYQGDNQNGGPY